VLWYSSAVRGWRLGGGERSASCSDVFSAGCSALPSIYINICLAVHR